MGGLSDDTGGASTFPKPVNTPVHRLDPERCYKPEIFFTRMLVHFCFILFIKASVARLVVEFFAIGTGAQGYRLLTRNAPLSEKTP